ncbi:hypothetical protein Vretifemale_1356, partial [Volvox reticuliferus]
QRSGEQCAGEPFSGRREKESTFLMAACPLGAVGSIGVRSVLQELSSWPGSGALIWRRHRIVMALALMKAIPAHPVGATNEPEVRKLHADEHCASCPRGEKAHDRVPCQQMSTVVTNEGSTAFCFFRG